MAASRPQLVRDSCFNPPSTNISDDKQPADRKTADAAGDAERAAPGAVKRSTTFGRFGQSMRPRCHRYCVVHMIRKAINQKKAKDSKAGD